MVSCRDRTDQVGSERQRANSAAITLGADGLVQDRTDQVGGERSECVSLT